MSDFDLSQYKDTPGVYPDNPIQEMHPEVTYRTRALIKNLAANPEVGKKHLESQGFQVQQLGGHNYAIKKPAEQEWRVLDPENSLFSMDTLADATDLIGDVGTIAAETGGAIAGGVGGTAVAPGAGTLVGTVGGGTLAAGAAEGAKGVLGSMFGLDQGLGDIAKDAGTEMLYAAGGGALAPGVGAATKAGVKTATQAGEVAGKVASTAYDAVGKASPTSKKVLDTIGKATGKVGSAAANTIPKWAKAGDPGERVRSYGRTMESAGQSPERIGWKLIESVNEKRGLSRKADRLQLKANIGEALEQLQVLDDAEKIVLSDFDRKVLQELERELPRILNTAADYNGIARDVAALSNRVVRNSYKDEVVEQYLKELDMPISLAKRPDGTYRLMRNGKPVPNEASHLAAIEARLEQRIADEGLDTMSKANSSLLRNIEEAATFDGGLDPKTALVIRGLMFGGPGALFGGALGGWGGAMLGGAAFAAGTKTAAVLGRALQRNPGMVTGLVEAAGKVPTPLSVKKSLLRAVAKDNKFPKAVSQMKPDEVDALLQRLGEQVQRQTTLSSQGRVAVYQLLNDPEARQWLQFVETLGEFGQQEQQEQQ